MNRVENKKQHDTYPLPPLIPPVFLLPPASVLSGPASAHLLLIFVKKEIIRKPEQRRSTYPLPPPQLHEEGANDFSSSAVSPVEAALSAMSPVEAYSMVKEIIRKKSEKKKRQEDKQKRTEVAPVVPPSEVSLSQALVVSVFSLS